MSDNSQDKASEEQEPSCSEALQRMSELVEGAREGRSGLDDGYALLLDLEEQGLPVNTAVFNQFLRIAVELAKGGHASTVDGERIVERLEHEGLPLDEDTYLQMMLLIAEAAKHIDPEPKGYLSEGYGWLERMYASELAGDLNITEPVVNAYVDIYHTQNKWGVYELDPYEYNWCVDDESEDALWQAHPDIGVEAHIKERYTEEELEEMDEAERRLLGDTADGLVASDDVSGASGHADSSDSGSDFPEPTSSSL